MAAAISYKHAPAETSVTQTGQHSTDPNATSNASVSFRRRFPKRPNLQESRRSSLCRRAIVPGAASSGETVKTMCVAFLVTSLVATMTGAAADASSDRHALPAGFVYLDQAIPDLVVELRYFTEHNFVGQPVDGYRHAHATLSAPAASALAEVQAELRPFGLELKIFDAYRPQRAVDHFVRWAKNLDDQRTKLDYYPNVEKEDLLEEGYIASQSSHSRGSTVDLTIVSRGEDGTIHELDMGSRFDFFGPISWPNSSMISVQQRANRVLLRSLMTKHGFAPYPQEWWHFTLRREPYPDTHFDFPN